MTKLTLTLLAAAVLTLPLQAQSLRIDVPFEFSVGAQTAPSGQYIIEYQPGSPVMTIEGLDRDARYHSNVLGGFGTPNRTEEPRLVFHRYGDQYFLAQIWTRMSKMNIPVTRMERELASRSTRAALVTVTASQGE